MSGRGRHSPVQNSNGGASGPALRCLSHRKLRVPSGPSHLGTGDFLCYLSTRSNGNRAAATFKNPESLALYYPQKAHPETMFAILSSAPTRLPSPRPKPHPRTLGKFTSRKTDVVQPTIPETRENPALFAFNSRKTPMYFAKQAPFLTFLLFRLVSICKKK